MLANECRSRDGIEDPRGILGVGLEKVRRG